MFQRTESLFVYGERNYSIFSLTVLEAVSRGEYLLSIGDDI